MTRLDAAAAKLAANGDVAAFTAAMAAADSRRSRLDHRFNEAGLTDCAINRRS